MTREEKINKIVEQRLEDMADYDSVDDNLRYFLTNGNVGYNQMTDEEIEDEYNDRFEYENEGDEDEE